MFHFPLGSFRVLPVGADAPHFCLIDQHSQSVQLQDYLGKQPLVILFYPVDRTLVCTKQLCELRDNYQRLVDEGIGVVAINPGDWEKKRAFAQAHDLPFPVLFDPETRTAVKYKATLINCLLNKRVVYGVDTQGKICYARRGKPSVDEILSGMNGKS